MKSPANLPRLLTLVFSLALANACASGDVEKEVDDPFDVAVGADGKGDGLEGLLPAEQLSRLEAAFDQVITAGQQTIDDLEAEIASLERDNRSKASEIDRLVAQMEDRRRELEDQHQRNLIFCVFFPNPATCALAVMITNDSRMQSLERDLGRARSQQTAIRDDIARFERRRDVLRADLVPLRASRERLVALFRNGVDASETPDALEPGSAEALAYSRAEVLREIATATRAEIAVLVDIRNAAAELAGALDAALSTVRALSTSVDALVEDARDQFMDIIEALLSGDPAAVARDWLDKALADKTRELLAGLDWPVREFVDHLIDARSTGELDTDALARDLLDSLLDGGDGPRSIALSSEVAIGIHDNTEAVSVIEVSGDLEARVVDVTVSIEHTYVGDLRIWLEHDGVELVLYDRTGGSDDDIDQTFSAELPAVTSVAGKWRLHVSDNAAADTGRLVRWDLVLRE